MVATRSLAEPDLDEEDEGENSGSLGWLVESLAFLPAAKIITFPGNNCAD